MPQVGETPELVACLSRYHVPVLETEEAFFATTERDFGSGNLYSPVVMAWTRTGPDIDLLNRYGFFDPGAKVGILMVDDGTGVDQHVVDDLWKPRLAALHIPVVATFTGPRDDGSAALGTTAQDMGNAVLHFRQAGVNHVLIAPGSGGQMYFFTRAADSQSYYPRMGLDSTSSPQNEVTAPSNSMAYAMAVSWDAIDYSTQGQRPPAPGVPANAARDRCGALYKPVAASSGVPLEQMYSWCDTLNLLQAALAGVHQHPTSIDLQRGVGTLGTSFQIASGVGPTHFGPGLYDGNSEARVMEFDTGTSNWVYKSPPATIP